MNFKTFDSTNSRQTKIGKHPKISMNGQTGQICFNIPAGELLKLSTDRGLIIVQDVDRPKDWYLHIGTGMEFIKIRERKVKTVDKKAFVIQAIEIVRSVFQAIEIKENYINFLIAGLPTEIDGKEYWAILTVHQAKK